MPPSVSVVIPTYNATRFLNRTLASVFAQEPLPTEVILSDDCSTDDTQRLADDIAKSSPVPLRFIRSPRNSGGPSEPLNRGIEAASSQLIATLDQDDWLLASSLRRRVELYEQRPSLGIVFGRASSQTIDGTRVGLVDRSNACLDEILKQEVSNGSFVISHEIAYEVLHRNFQYTVSCSNFLFPKLIWQNVGGFANSIHAACDYAFVQGVTRQYDVGFVDAEIFFWDRRDDNLTVTLGTRSELDWVRLYGRFDAKFARAESRKSLLMCMRRKSSSAWMSCAYAHRNEGLYGQAVKFYLCACIAGSGVLPAALGLCKLPLHWAGRITGIRRRPT